MENTSELYSMNKGRLKPAEFIPISILAQTATTKSRKQDMIGTHTQTLPMLPTSSFWYINLRNNHITKKKISLY